AEQLALRVDDERDLHAAGVDALDRRAYARLGREGEGLPVAHALILSAGTPLTRAPSGTSRVTTAPAATRQPLPMRTPCTTVAPVPTCVLWPTVTAPERVTPGARCTCAPMSQS